MEFDTITFDLYQRLCKVFPLATTSSATDLIRRVRSIKSAYELAIIKDCALQIDRVHQRAKEVIKIGMTELELASELEFCARREGHPGIVRMRSYNGELFYGQITAGTDSAAPAYCDTPLGGMGLTPAVGQGASYRRIRANEPIIVDFCGAFDGYLADQTRVFSIGALPEKLHRAYDDMIRIENRCKEIARPGVSWGAIYDSCLQYACELGYEESFMGNRGAQVSFIGHGLGIEIDEYPFIARGFHDRLLEPGMVFAFEPKAVFPGLGAVGIENTFRVSDDGIKHITFSSEELVILSP
jgi:Xaa-Pro dipeptidase